jgi:hypothetical protein
MKILMLRLMNLFFDLFFFKFNFFIFIERMNSEEEITQLKEIIENQNLLIKRLKEKNLSNHIQENRMNDKELNKFLRKELFDELKNKDAIDIIIHNIIYGFYNIDEQHPFTEPSHEKNQRLINKLNNVLDNLCR